MKINNLNNVQKEIFNKILEYNVFPIDEEHLYLKKVNNENILIYRYKSENENKFDVSIEIGLKTYAIYCENWHESDVYINSKEDMDILFQKLVTFFNGSTRLVVEYSNQKPFCWELQYRNNKEWKPLGKTKLILFNYFGKKDKKIKVNFFIKE